jgi:hypothetical protein
MTPPRERRYAIVQGPGAPDDADALAALLHAGDEGARVDRPASLKGWMASPADVLVFRGDDRLQRRPWGADVRALEGRKVVGIGCDAAKMFESLGMELRFGHLAPSHARTQSIAMVPSTLLPDAPSGQEIVAFRDAPFLAYAHDNVALHLPVGGHLRGAVEALALWPNPNYAPLARQGNHVFLGIAVPIPSWTEPFRDAVARVLRALHDRPAEPFARARWDETEPGEETFTLAKGGDSEGGYTRSAFLRFANPVRLRARLEQEGSSAAMLLLAASRDSRTHERADGGSGASIAIDATIDADAVRRNADGWWELRATNFDPQNPARCTLHIAVDPAS